MATNTKRNLGVISLFAAVIIAAIAGKTLADKPDEKEKAKPKPKPRVTISKETTVITEPLRPDGYPDYVGALNQRFSKGVTPENNFAVLFWKAVGPGEIYEETREQYFQMLGIPPLPEKGDYLITFDELEKAQVEHLKDQQQSEDEVKKLLWDQFTSAMRRPWTRERLPWLAEWLDANEKPLNMLVEASKRPRRYDPLIGKYAIAILLPGPQKSRDVARALAARAMLWAGEGKAEDAWQDLLACHRIARLVGQGPTLVEVLVAITDDGIAQAGDRALIEHGKLTTAQIAAMRADLARLPPMPKMVEKVDGGERLTFLDIVMTFAREDLDGFSEVANMEKWNENEKAFAAIIEAVGIAVIDWDIILQMGNSWYDRLVVGLKKPTCAQRRAAFDEIDKALKKLAKSARDLQSLTWSLLGVSKKAISERVGHILVALFLPACHAASVAEDRSAIQAELTDLAFALAAYRADNGKYPAKLDELAPKYVKALRDKSNYKDIELRYRRQKDGYLLYSFGPNGVDDGGKGFEERRKLDNWSSEDWDDIAVRVPSKAE